MKCDLVSTGLYVYCLLTALGSQSTVRAARPNLLTLCCGALYGLLYGLFRAAFRPTCRPCTSSYPFAHHTHSATSRLPQLHNIYMEPLNVWCPVSSRSCQ